MWEEIQRNIKDLSRSGRLAAPNSALKVLYHLPLRLAPGSSDTAGYRVSAFVDHNQSAGSVRDYHGGTRTYDGHRGTDFALWPFAWNKVDAGEVQVIAAADGTIVYSANVDPSDHNCGSSSNDPWNYVALTHADGHMTIYGHMRYNSLTNKGVGQTVLQGEYLGTAASSGNSSGPHLHFEVRYGSYSNTEWLDPYAGLNSQPESLWASQPPYLDSAINKLATHSSPPSTPDPCQPSITNLQDSFTTPARIYFYTYYRDYQSVLPTSLRIYRPDESIYLSWQYSPGGNNFYSSWSQGWVFDFTADDPSGKWRFEATYNGQVYQTSFFINSALIAGDDNALTLKNSPITIDVLSNDFSSNHVQLTITAMTQPTHGNASLVDSHIVYTPSADFLGADSWTYTVSSATANATATVKVWVVSEIFREFLPLLQR